MSGRKAAVLIGSLSLAAAAALAALPVGVAGAAPARPEARQHAVCPAVARGYARCLAHVVNAPAPEGHRPGPSATTPHGYSPATITGAYGFATTGGAGETIGIVDAYGAPTVTSNLETFSSYYGLGTCTHADGCFTKVNQSGGTSYPRAISDWALEQSLDVEWAHSMAPKAHILLVEATTSSFTNLLTAVSYAASHANYVSMSWGGTEFSGETADDSAYFTKSGVSYFAAAGDTGASVLYPSASPDVVSVGGTTLTVTGTTWKAETAWKTAGGGCSSYETANQAQSAYQTYANVTCGGKRATPDISLDANPATGVSVYDTERLSTGQSGWLQVGGTSASTVMVAAHAAETASAVNASVLYSHTLKVYDVTSGSNGHTCTVGYDLCTGLGSWNTAAGTTGGSSSGATTGTLSFTPSAGQTLAAGAQSAPIAVTLSSTATSGLTVSLATTTGGFSTTANATSYSTTLTLHVSATAFKSQTFYYESTKAGAHTVSASATGWTSASQTETVTAAALSRIAVSPANATVPEGGTQTFSATGFDKYTNPVTLSAPSWSLTSSSLGTLAPVSGQSTTFTAGTTSGTGSIKVTTGTISGSATVTVSAAAALEASIHVGSSSKHGPWWHTPITVHATQGGVAVSGATVSLTVYAGRSCSGTVEATGTGSTGTNGTVAFTFKTRSTGTYCALALVRDGSQSTNVSEAFTV